MENLSMQWFWTITSICILALPCIDARRKSKFDDVPHFISEPESAIVKEGTKVVLRCSAKPSTAEITWKVNNTDASLLADLIGIKIVPNKLIIPAFSTNRILSHAGVYQCTAKTSLGTIASRTAHIQSAYLGELVESGNSVVNYTEGNTALIGCAIPRGRPAPTNWFIFNDTIINTSTGKYQLLPSGNLHIESVTREDAGEYRCVVYNPVNKVKRTYNSTVQLQVSKTISKRPPRRILPQTEEALVLGRLGANVTLECVMNGSPVPRVTWTVYGGQLPAGRHRQINGNLELWNLDVMDQRTYICNGENGIGKPAMGRYVLEIQDALRITSKPQHQMVTEGDPVLFRCRFDGAHLQSMKPRVVWTHNTHRLTNGGPYKIRGTSLRIHEVKASHAGIYQCHIRHVKASVGLIVLPKPTQATTLGNDKPLPPSKPRALQATATSVMLQWTMPISRSSTILVDYLQVQYKRKKEKEWTSVNVRLPPDTRFYDILNLRAGAKYRFRVVAVYKNGVRKAGEYSSRLRMRRPHTYEMGDGPIDPSNPQSVPDVVPTDKQKSAVYSTLAPPVNYTVPAIVKPTSKPCKRRGKKGRRKNRKCKPIGKNSLMVPPDKPVVSKLSDSSVMVSWKVKPNKGLPISLFRVQYRKVGKKNGQTSWSTLDTDIDKDQNKFEVNGLKPNSVYRFKIAAIYSNNDNRASPSSDKFHLRRVSALPPRPDNGPVIVQVRPLSATSMLVEWQYLHADKIPIEGFHIHYKPYHDHVPFKMNPVIGVDERKFVINNLRPDTDYTFKMQGFNSAGASQFSNWVTRKTLKGSGTYYIPPTKSIVPLKPIDKDSPANPSKIYIIDSGNGSDTTPYDPYGDSLNGRQSTKHSNETLYMILGIVLGVMMLILVIFMVMCGWKQRQQRRMLAIDASIRSKYMDPSQSIHRDTLRSKHTNGFLLNGVNGNGKVSNGNGHIGNGYIPNGHPHRNSGSNMNISVNPMTELPEQQYNTDSEAYKNSDLHDSAAELSAYEQAPTLRSFQCPQKQQYSSVDRNRNNRPYKENMEFIEHNTVDRIDQRNHSQDRTNYYPEYNSMNRPYELSHDSSQSHDQGDHIHRSHDRNIANESQGSSKHKRRRKRMHHQREPQTFMKDQATNTDLSSNEGTLDTQGSGNKPTDTNNHVIHNPELSVRTQNAHSTDYRQLPDDVYNDGD